MPLHPNVRRCTHIQVTGHRCGSPALKQEYFCYFHTRMIKGVQTRVDSQIHPVALVENAEAIQAAIMHTIDAVLKGTMDNKRANIVLKALYIAVRNSRNVYFHLSQDEMVREVPNYAQQYLIEHPELNAPEANPTARSPSEPNAHVEPDAPIRGAEQSSAASGHAPGPETNQKKESHPERAHKRESKDPETADTVKTESGNSHRRHKKTDQEAWGENTPPLTTRQSETWQEIKKLEACIEGAMRGNWRDVRTVFNAVGLTPRKPPTNQSVKRIAPHPKCHTELEDRSNTQTNCHSERSEESAVRLEAGKCNVR